MPRPYAFASAFRIVLGLLMTLTFIGCSGRDQDDHVTSTADPDGRTALHLPAEGRHMVLAEMRLMLTSVQGFVAGAALGDTAAMRTAASAAGMAAAQDMNPAIEQRLPPEFLRLGMATHAAWDSLAIDVSTGAPTNQVLGRLGTVMSNCVSCHAQFRIEAAGTGY